MKANGKSKVVTFRVTEEKLNEIKRRADERGLTVSQFAEEQIMYEGGMSQTQQQQVYANLCRLRDAVQNIDRFGSKKVLEECDQLWHTLKL